MYLITHFKNDGCTTEVSYSPVKKILQRLKYTLIHLSCISYKVAFHSSRTVCLAFMKAMNHDQNMRLEKYFDKVTNSTDQNHSQIPDRHTAGQGTPDPLQNPRFHYHTTACQWTLPQVSSIQSRVYLF